MTTTMKRLGSNAGSSRRRHFGVCRERRVVPVERYVPHWFPVKPDRRQLSTKEFLLHKKVWFRDLLIGFSEGDG